MSENNKENTHDDEIKTIIENFIKDYTGKELFSNIKQGMPIVLNLDSLSVLLFECVTHVGKITSQEHITQRKLNIERETNKELN